MTPLAIFLGTYLVLALGRVPGWRVDRAGAAVIGASLTVTLATLAAGVLWLTSVR
jgi:hypothetical protein